MIACWLAHDARDGGEDRRVVLRERFLTVLFAVQVLAASTRSCSTCGTRSRTPRPLLSCCKQEPYANRVLVGSHDFAMQPISAYARRPIFHPENGSFRTFVDWGANRRVTQPIDALKAAVALARAAGRGGTDDPQRRAVRVPGDLARPADPSDAYLRYVAGFDGAIVEDENYVVVWVSPPAAR